MTTGSGNSGSIDDEESYAEEEELADERDDLTEGASLIIYLEKKNLRKCERCCGRDSM